jgi:hypothetical protein
MEGREDVEFARADLMARAGSLQSLATIGCGAAHLRRRPAAAS